MTRQNESKYVHAIIAWIKEQGGDAWKVHGSAYQRVGEPDIDGWIPNPDGGFYHLKLEVKTPTGKASDIQKYRIEKYKQAGYVAGIVVTVEDVKKLL